MLAIIIILYPLLMTIVDTAHVRKEQCSTSVCQQSAHFMSNALDRQVSPCNDFYQFACGGWLQQYEQIPSTKPLYSVAIQAQDNMINIIRSLLENNHTIQQHSSHTIRLAKFLYDQCLSIDNQTTNDQSHLVESLFTVHNDDDNDETWWNIYQSNWAAIHTLFRIGVVTNPRNTSQRILAMGTVSFALDDIVDDDDKDEKNENRYIIDEYENFLRKISTLIPYFRQQNDLQITKQINETINLQLKLAKMKMSNLDYQNLSKIINIMNIDEFEKQTNFQWLNRIIRPTFRMFNVSDSEISGENLILITDVGYFRKFIGLIETIPNKQIRTFLDLDIAQMITPYLGEQYRRYMFEFLKSSSGVQKTPNRWRTCYSQIEKTLPWALSRLYVDEKQFDSEDLIKATKLVDSIHETFISMITNQQSWIDDNVRQLSLQKLNHIKKNIAFPQWLLDDRHLDQIYHLENYNNDHNSLNDYIPTIINFEWIQMQANLLLLNNDNNLPDFDDIEGWAMEPSKINAAYAPFANTITIPAALLTPPFYDSTLPLSMNYGAIGSIIGHELTHSLDNDGLRFDHNGNYHLKALYDENIWLSDDMLHSFNKQSECLVEQYSNIQEPWTGLKLDGNNTLGENIADNGGLRQAFYAFRNQTYQHPQQANQILADLDDFDPEQLFFLANAQIWCTKYRRQSLSSIIDYDPHVPARYRVNIPASNLPEFADAFDCPSGSPMNPNRKCILW
ncbi:hypothetical protein DERP_010755 [Dermatophagoides pteronyssinus]|uniref:Neprilysin-1-like n=1 Tax=Dermatophagoides pteronyssinus TaxID=6956 RepID=A0ABQ8J6M3_DERPT|nr:hypothetical protein DERP_010755 [Dermatophagoides pteronyssinus]